MSGAVDIAAPAARNDRILRVLDRLSEGVLVAALLGELAAVLANVFARSFFGRSFLWTDEVARLALSLLTFVGGIVAYRHGHHAFVRVVLNALPAWLQRAAAALSDLLVLLMAVVTVATSLPFIESGWGELTPILQLPAATIALPLTGSMVLLAVYAIERLRGQDRRAVLAAGVPLALLVTAAFLLREAWLPWFAGDAAIAASLLLLLVVILAGLPVGFALLLAAASYLWTSDTVPMVALPQNIVSGTGNFILLALPFFIFAGLIMERGGISLRLIRFVQASVGHLRGGLLQVMVLSMYLVSGLSGSKAADVAAVGSVMRDMLRRERLSDAEGAAVLAASATMGETVPPSIAMLILGSITKLSMAALFIAGLVPAAVIAVCLMVLIYVRARLAKVPRGSRTALVPLLRAGLGAVLPLLMPVMLFAGILTGVATPTEVSSFAVVYGLFLAIVLYREMDLRSFARTVIDSATLTGLVLFILAAASSFSFSLTIAYVPQRLVELLHSINDSTTLFLLGSILLLIVVGSLLEGLPALNVLAPLLLPIAGKIGISELHYGILLIIAMGIGAFIPPAGVGFYVCCAVMRTDIEAATRVMAPYLTVLLIGLLIVTFVPWFTLSLPRAFGFG